MTYGVKPLKSISKMKATVSTGGRVPTGDPAVNCVMLRFNGVEYTRFLHLFEQSGVRNKAQFAKARIFNEPFRVIKVDSTLLSYYTKLSNLYAQFRAVGVNYNQVVKELKSHFSEKKAMALLFSLEKATLELVRTNKEIIELTNQFQEKWSQKSV